MPRNNTPGQEFTTIVTGAALPDSQMTPRNVTVFPRPQEDCQSTSAIREAERGLVDLRSQFLRKDKKKIGVGESLSAIAVSSCTLTILSNGAPD